MNIPITATPAEALGFRLATMTEAEIRELAEHPALLTRVLDTRNVANLLLNDPRPYPPTIRRERRVGPVRLRKMELELSEDEVRHA